MHWKVTVEQQCFPVSQYLLPTVGYWNSNARVYVGHVGDSADPQEIAETAQKIHNFMRSPCFHERPSFHAWIADSLTGHILADYTLSYGSAYDYFDSNQNPLKYIYTPILTFGTDVADFAGALLTYETCKHPKRKINTSCTPKASSLTQLLKTCATRIKNCGKK